MSVCPGELGSIQCVTTEQPILWTSDSGNRLFSSELQAPVMLGNLTLSVVSVMVDGSNLRVTSNATISYSKLSGSLMVECREATTSNSESATFIPAGKCMLTCMCTTFVYNLLCLHK